MLNATHRILVTDAERGSAVSIIRSLGRLGWRVFPAASRADSPGFRSRLASEPVLYPSPSDDPDAYVAAILEAVRRLGVELVIPVSDAAFVEAVTVTRADPIRARDPKQVASELAQLRPSIAVRVIEEPYEAVRRSREELQGTTMLCVVGSVYLAGIARRVLVGA